MPIDDPLLMVSIKPQFTQSSLVIIWSNFFEQCLSGHKGELGSHKSDVNLFRRLEMLYSSGMITNEPVILSILFIPIDFFFWGVKCVYCMISCKKTLSERVMLL